MNTCSMHETTVDCGAYAPTSLCPPGTEVQQIVVGSGPVVPSSNPPTTVAISSQNSRSSDGPSQSALVGAIIAVARVVLILSACILCLCCKPRRDDTPSYTFYGGLRDRTWRRGSHDPVVPLQPLPPRGPRPPRAPGLLHWILHHPVLLQLAHPSHKPLQRQAHQLHSLLSGIVD